MNKLVAILTALFFLSFVDEIPCFTLHDAKDGSSDVRVEENRHEGIDEVFEGVDEVFEGIDEVFEGVDEVFDPSTHGEEVTLDDGDTAILLQVDEGGEWMASQTQPVNQRKRRQVVIETPTEAGSCKINIRDCATKNGTCIRIVNVNVCRTTDNTLDLNSKTCASSTQPNVACTVESCQLTQQIGRCVSLRGGTKACEGSGEPRFLVPESRDCV